MEMKDRQRIEVPRQRVWDALNDPAILQQCFPGCQSIEKEADDRMRAVLAIKIGPVNAKFNVVVVLSELDPPKSYILSGEGQGGNAGVAKGEMKVVLTEDAGATELDYNVDVQVGGRLAQVGGALIDATAQRLAERFFTRFSEIVSATEESEDAAKEPSVIREPQALSDGAASNTSDRLRQQDAAGRPGTMPKFRSTILLAGWFSTVALAAMTGFLVGRTQGVGAGGGSDWMGVAIGLLLLLVVGVGFAIGRQTAQQMIVLNAGELARYLRERQQ